MTHSRLNTGLALRSLQSLKLLCTRVLLALLLPAAAQAQQNLQSLDQIAAVAQQAVAATLPRSATIQAEPPDARLRLPACAQMPQAEIGNGHGASVSVAVRCTAPAPWQVYLSVRVSDPRPVLVLTRSVRRGETVDASLLKPETRDVAQLPFGYLADADAVQNYQFRRPLAAGQAPGADDLAPPSWVRRGDAVQLITRLQGIEVRADGKALSEGSQGVRVRVENSRSKRIIEGRVTAPGVVEVGS